MAPELDVVFWPPARVGLSSAWWGHVPFAHWLVSATHPTQFVELGTHHGVSYAAFCEPVLRQRLATRCFAVDTWQGDEHTGTYDQRVYEDLRHFHDSRYAAFSVLLRTTFDDALNHFADGSIDLLHIDGCHTYEVVKHDFQNWLPKLSKRAVVLFHDTNVRKRGFGVWRLWSEMQETYPSFEFTHGHGLGILAVGSEIPEKVMSLCRLNTAEARRIQERFADLGERWIAVDHAKRTAEEAATQAIATMHARQGQEEELQRARAAAQVREAELETLQHAMAAAGARQSELETLVSALLSSTSWRLTRPLRGVRRAWSEPDFRRRVVRRLIKKVLIAAPIPSSLKTRILERARRLQSPTLLSPSTHTYANWIERYDTLTPSDTRAIQRQIEAWPNRPLISVVVPVYNTDERHLDEMIQSVRDQIYPNWELCIADDASTRIHVRQVLERHRQGDDRIKVTYRDVNGHISAATNSALELATGEFIALLDHDDLLPAHALSTVVDAIVRHPTAEVFYSDEDKVDQDGKRYDPYFKPDWNPELLYGQNYISHLGVYSSRLVKSIGGFRLGYEGSQDYDLALRATAATNGPIVHIPHILYHWRLFKGAQTFSSTQLEVATSAARRAIQDCLAAQGERVAVIDAVGGYHRVVREEPSAWPRVTAVIPTRDHVDVLRECLNGLINLTDYPNLEVIIADNDSVEPATLKFFKDVQSQAVRIVNAPGVFNYSRINNEAIRQATGDVILLLNNDVSMLEASWLKEMVKHLVHKKVAAVGAKLFYPDRTLQHGGVVLGMGGVAGHVHLGASLDDPGYFARLMLPQDVSCVTAACMAVKKSIFDKVGGFDETNLSVAFNDVDLCIRIRKAGYRIVWTPYVQLLHHESKSRGSDLEAAKLPRFMKEIAYMEDTWRDALARDPFYNPNLSLDSTTPQLAFPPRIGRPWSTVPRPMDS
jgi:GT2 family glycosyltransferase